MTATFDRERAFDLIQAALHDYEAGDGFAVDSVVERLAACVEPFAWQNLEDLLAEHYPEDIFPVRADDPSVDPGPRILSLARLLHRAEAKLARIEARLNEHHPGEAQYVGDLRAILRGES